MARYIDADKVLKQMIEKFKCIPLIGVTKYINGEEYFEGEHLDTIIKETPTSDVEEVKHGKWQLGRTGRNLVCSCCETQVPFKKDNKKKYHLAWYSPYCSNCGAKMDGGNAE